MNKPQIDIEKEIPVPQWRGKYPLKEMAVSDSIFIPGQFASSARQSAYNLSAQSEKYNFITRTVDGGIRIWRVEA